MVGPPAGRADPVEDRGWPGNHVWMTFHVRSPPSWTSTCTGRRAGTRHAVGNFPGAADDHGGVDSLLTRIPRRGVLPAVLALILLIVGAGPAWAHVEATAEGAQAGTGPVTVAFLAEAESTTAGIVSVKTQLLEGVLPEWVSLASGPAGWTLATTADGYEIGGPDIGPGVDLEFAITIGQLPPDITELPFKTLLRYSDGREDAWIELPSASNPQPERPAPTIAVAPAPPGTTTAPSSPSAPASDVTSAAPTETETDQGAQASTQDDGTFSTGLVAVIAVVLAALAGGFWFWRARASRNP